MIKNIEVGDLGQIIKELDKLLNLKIAKAVDQQLRDFRRYILKDKNMEMNSYEYIRSINWYQNEINKKLVEVHNCNNIKDNTKEIISLLSRLECRIEQFLRHRDIWHKDSDNFKLILRDSYSKILDKCKEVIELPNFLINKK